MTTATPEIGRPKKVGLLGAPNRGHGQGQGTPTPDAGYALTLANKILHDLGVHDAHLLHDLEAGVAALASKRAGLFGRGPSRTDVLYVLELLGISSAASLTPTLVHPFHGLAHSYFKLQKFVDSISSDDLRHTNDAVPTQSH